MSAVQIWALVAGGIWLVLALAVPRFGPRHRLRGFWALIAGGVPVLGLLTLTLGPLAGLGGFGMGLSLLFCQPFGHRRAPRTDDSAPSLATAPRGR